MALRTAVNPACSAAVTDVELRAEVAETSRVVRELAQQIGGQGNKFGSFTEGLAYHSCRKILRERFGTEEIYHEVEVARKDGSNEQYDMLGIVNGTKNEAVVVEIKSQLRERDLERTLQKLREFPKFLPQYAGMKGKGLVTAVYLPQGMAQKVAEAGLHLATGADENFTLQPTPPGFRPAEF